MRKEQQTRRSARIRSAERTAALWTAWRQRVAGRRLPLPLGGAQMRCIVAQLQTHQLCGPLRARRLCIRRFCNHAQPSRLWRCRLRLKNRLELKDNRQALAQDKRAQAQERRHTNGRMRDVQKQSSTDRELDPLPPLGWVRGFSLGMLRRLPARRKPAAGRKRGLGSQP
jgi:hypothetical protein